MRQEGQHILIKTPKNSSSNPFKTISLEYIDTSSKQYLNLTNQQFRKKYSTIIKQCNHLIKSGFQSKALQILQIAQKQLQESLRCGKKVDQVLLTAVLNNSAYIYQKLDNPSKSLDKIRILLQTHNNKPLNLQSESNFDEKLSNLCLKVSIAKYYIYFLTLTIQLNMFEASSIPANRTIQYFKKFCKDYRKLGFSPILINPKMTQELLRQIQEFQQDFNNNSLDQVMQMVKQSLGQVKKVTIKNNDDYKIQSYTLQHLSMIEIFDIKENKQETLQKNEKGKVFQNGLLQFAVALFYIGKSIFQSLNHRYKNKQDTEIKIASFDKAKKYVLWSLHFSCQLCNHYMKIHKQIFNYYQQNFAKEKQEQRKNLKVINSLQSPSLKKLQAWNQIALLINKIESQKHKISSSQTSIKQRKTKNLKSHQKNYGATKPQSSQNKNAKTALGHRRYQRQNSEQIFKIKKNSVTHINSIQKFKTEQNIVDQNKQQQCEQQKKQQKIKPNKKNKNNYSKNKSRKNIKNSFSRSLSKEKGHIKGLEHQKQRINKSPKQKSKGLLDHKMKLSTPLQDYFPKSREKQIGAVKRMQARSHEKEEKQFALSLQKKIKEGAKKLHKKHRQLFKSLTKL